MKYGPWEISEDENKRIALYEKMQKLASRKAKELDTLFKFDCAEATKKNKKHPLHLWVNLPSLICRISADLMLSQPPALSHPDPATQERIDRIFKRSKLYNTTWRAVYWMCAQGDAYLCVADTMTAGERAPVISLRRATGSVARGLLPEAPTDAKQFLFKSNVNGLELYTELSAGMNRMFAFKGEEPIALPAGYAPEVFTGEDSALAVHLGSMRADESDSGQGESDLFDIEEICYEISNRFRQVAKILDDHSEPPMNVPPGTLDEKGVHEVRTNKVFEYDVNGLGAAYVGWQSQLEAAYTEIENLTSIAAMMSETPLPLLGKDAGGGAAESGRALKFRLLTGLGKARRNGNCVRSALLEAMRLALRREDTLKGNTKQDYPELTCTMAETFIADEAEQADYVEKLRRSSVISVQRAVEMTQGLSGDELTEEVDRINAEQAVPAAPLGFDNGRIPPTAVA